MENCLLSARELVEYLYGYKDESIRKSIDYYRRNGFIPDKFIEKGSWKQIKYKYKKNGFIYIRNLLELAQRISNPKMAFNALANEVNEKKFKKKIAIAKREHEEIAAKHASYIEEMDDIEEIILKQGIDVEKNLIFSEERDVHTFKLLESIKKRQIVCEDNADRALYYLKLGVYDLAEKLIDEVIEEKSNYWKAHFIKAIIYLNRLHNNQAKMNKYRILIDSDPDQKHIENMYNDLLRKKSTHGESAYDSLISAYKYWTDPKYTSLTDMLSKRNLISSIISLTFERINYRTGSGVREKDLLEEIIRDNFNTTSDINILIQYLHIADNINKNLYSIVFNKLIDEIKKKPHNIQKYISPENNEGNLYIWAFNYHLDKTLTSDEKANLIKGCHHKEIKLVNSYYRDILLNYRKILKVLAKEYEKECYDKVFKMLEEELDQLDPESYYYPRLLFSYVRVCYDLSKTAYNNDDYDKAVNYYIKPFNYEDDIISYFNHLKANEYMEGEYDGFQYYTYDFIGDSSSWLVEYQYNPDKRKFNGNPGYLDLLAKIMEGTFDHGLKEVVKGLEQKYFGKEVV